jgi:Cu(I)/Ag(I) efflux system membrane fusion protein
MTDPQNRPTSQDEQETAQDAPGTRKRRWFRLGLRPGLRKAAAVVWPRIAVPVVVILAFLAGLRLGTPAPIHATEHGQKGQAASKATVWTCSMHPQFKLPEPGQCPICAMGLIPLVATDEDAETDTQVSLSERAKTLAQVRTAPVRRAETGVEVRLLGRLEYDETRERTVTPWTAGRIDRLMVSNVGASVGPGQVIAHLFSPEVYSAHQDLIQAKRQRASLRDGLAGAQTAASAALEAARTRLVLLGVSSEDIDQMERADTPWRYVKIRSDFGGTVLELHVAQGAYVAAGSPLFRLADLSRLWVQLDAYENDLSRIAPKQDVTLRVDSFPGEVFQGKIAFIDRVVDPRMRTARVRVEVANKDGRLRPGMFAQAVIDAPAEKASESPLVVPDTAPLFTGMRSVVYVEVPGEERPTYEAREVRLGPRAGDLYPVVSGLEEGEQVVTQGAFRLDSDLQIRGGRSMMTLDDDRKRAAESAIDVPAAFLQGLAPTVEAYLALHVALSRDDLDKTREAYRALGEKASSFRPRGPEEGMRVWTELGAGVTQDALQGAKAEDLDTARRLFEPVSDRLIRAMRRFGNPLKDPVRFAFCPMAAGSKGAFWLQKASEIENPYFGASMFACGEVRASLGPGQRIVPDAAGKPPQPPKPAEHNH